MFGLPSLEDILFKKLQTQMTTLSGVVSGFGSAALGLAETTLKVNKAILQEILNMSAELDRLKQEVTEARTVIESGNVLIASLAQQVRDNAENPEALRQLADDLDASVNSLSATIAANTRAQGEAPVLPDEPPADGTSGSDTFMGEDTQTSPLGGAEGEDSLTGDSTIGSDADVLPGDADITGESDLEDLGDESEFDEEGEEEE